MTQHAVLLFLNVSDGDFGSSRDMKRVLDLCEELEHAIVSSGAGEFDGEEVGGSQAVVYMYGPDADVLFAAIEPALQRFAAAPESYAIKRYGEVGDPDVKDIRIRL